jgi:hypothetical protein
VSMRDSSYPPNWRFVGVVDEQMHHVTCICGNVMRRMGAGIIS